MVDNLKFFNTGFSALDPVWLVPEVFWVSDFLWSFRKLIIHFANREH